MVTVIIEIEKKREYIFREMICIIKQQLAFIFVVAEKILPDLKLCDPLILRLVCSLNKLAQDVIGYKARATRRRYFIILILTISFIIDGIIKVNMLPQQPLALYFNTTPIDTTYTSFVKVRNEADLFASFQD